MMLRQLVTPREFELTTLIHLGWSNPEIAEAMGITENTVKHSLTSIFNKTGCDNRVMLAVRYGRERVRQAKA